MTSRDRTLRERIGLVAVILVIVVAGCSGGTADSTAAGGADGASGAAPGGGDGGSAAQAAGGGTDGELAVGSHYAQGADRVVVRNASMELRVDDFQDAFGEIRTLVVGNGGYLGDRSQRGEGDWDAGTIVIKVPADTFGAVRAELAALGRVEHETVDVLDFTSSFRSRQEEIATLEADRDRLRRALNRTDDPENATELQSELEEVRSNLQELQERQQRLRQRASMSTIVLRMHEPETRKPMDDRVTVADFSAAASGAFSGGLKVLRGTVAVVAYAVPVAAALALLGLAGAVGLVLTRPIVVRTVRLIQRLAPDDRRFQRQSRPPAARTRSGRQSADPAERDSDGTARDENAAGSDGEGNQGASDDESGDESNGESGDERQC